jgi:hypothetical protein
MAIDSQGATNEIQIGGEEASGSRPLLKSQIDFSAKEKTTKVQEVSVEKVQDSPPRSQPKGAPTKVIEPVIEPPCEPIE